MADYEQLDAQAADPSLQAYTDPTTGQVVFMRATDDPAALQQRAAKGLLQATPEDIEARKQYLRNTETARQAITAGKLGANVATFGLAGFDSAEDKQQIAAFRDASPTLSTLTEVAGAAAPGLVTGGAASAAMAGLGFGARAAGIGSMIAEEVAASAAVEREQAAEEGRDISFANVVSGLPLAAGVSAAARLARTGASFGKYAADKALRRANAVAPDVEDLAARPNAISTGAKTSKARRSVGAAGAADEGYQPLRNEDVRWRAENHDDLAAETNKLAGDALDGLEGGEAPDFDAVHNVGLKETDIAGRMGDGDSTAMLDYADEHMKKLDETATQLEKQGQLGAAKRLRARADALAQTYTLVDEAPEKLVIAADQTKRELQRLQRKYRIMARSDATAEGIVQALDEIEGPMREGLEDAKIWGQDWASKQTIENGEWQELIRHGAMWQGEFMQRAHGAAGKAWRGEREVPVFISRGDAVEHVTGMNKKKMKETIGAMRKYADAVDRMNQVKESLDVASIQQTPIARLKQHVEDLRTVADELEDTWYVMNERGGKDIAAKARNKRQATGPLEAAFEIGKEIPGLGSTLRGAEKLKEAATGKGFFDLPVNPAKPDLTTDAARAAVNARRGSSGPYRPPSGGGPDGGAIPKPGPRPVETSPAAAPEAAQPRTAARGSASVGAMAGAAGLGVTALAAHPVMQLLKDMNDDNERIRERAALGLVAPATRPAPLPSTIERFKEGAQSLADSFTMRRDDLTNALANPEALLAGLDDAFGDLGETHPNLYGDILARSHAAAQYVMASAPPSVAIGLTRPDGISPDPLALAKFADIWSGAFNPGDVIYDVGTGHATPTQVKALKDVHPDVYDALRLDILKAVGEAEGRVPFETLRKLDVLFDVPGIAPPSFQPAMSKTMQAAWAEPAGGNRGKPSEIAGPGDPNAKFGAGPSSLQ